MRQAPAGAPRHARPAAPSWAPPNVRARPWRGRRTRAPRFGTGNGNRSPRVGSSSSTSGSIRSATVSVACGRLAGAWLGIPASRSPSQMCRTAPSVSGSKTISTEWTMQPARFVTHCASKADALIDSNSAALIAPAPAGSTARTAANRAARVDQPARPHRRLFPAQRERRRRGADAASRRRRRRKCWRWPPTSRGWRAATRSAPNPAWRNKNAIAADKLIPIDKLDARKGEAIYAERCTSCHGADGQGVQIGDKKAGPLWGAGLVERRRRRGARLHAGRDHPLHDAVSRTRAA